MCQLKSCCGILSLRIGCMISAGYTVIIGALYITRYIWLISGHASSMDSERIVLTDQLNETFPNASQETIDYLAKGRLPYIQVIYIFMLVLHIIWVLTGVTIFAAVTTRKRGFLLPWIIITPVLTGLITLGIAVAVFKFELSTAVNLGVNIFGNLWAFVCVASFYQNKCLEADGDAKLGGTRSDKVTYEQVGNDQLA